MSCRKEICAKNRCLAKCDATTGTSTNRRALKTLQHPTRNLGKTVEKCDLEKNKSSVKFPALLEKKGVSGKENRSSIPLRRKSSIIAKSKRNEETKVKTPPSKLSFANLPTAASSTLIFEKGPKPKIEFIDVSPITPNQKTNPQSLFHNPPCLERFEELVANRMQTAVNNKIMKSEYSPYTLNLDIYNCEYMDDIINYLLCHQKKFIPPKINYVGVNRFSIVNWLFKVQRMFTQPSSMVFMAARLFDIVMLKMDIPINMYQLVAVALFWIVHKAHCINTSVFVFDVKHLLDICKKAYDQKDLFKMETKMLKFFNFEVNVPDPSTFLIYYFHKMNIDSKEIKDIAVYVLESFILHDNSSMHPPSVQAAASCYLTLYTLNSLKVNESWRKLKTCPAYYTPLSIRPVVRQIATQIKTINLGGPFEYEPESKFVLRIDCKMHQNFLSRIKRIEI